MFSLCLGKRRQKKKWIYWGVAGEGVWTESEENDFSDPPTGFLLLGDYAGFAISVSQCIYFFFSWLSFTVIKRCNF